MVGFYWNLLDWRLCGSRGQFRYRLIERLNLLSSDRFLLFLFWHSIRRIGVFTILGRLHDPGCMVLSELDPPRNIRAWCSPDLTEFEKEGRCLE
jgi:hypothetical protein